MTHEEAAALLSSPSAHKRLMAARFISRNPKKELLAVLRQALQKETESYARSGIQLAIERSSSSPQPPAAVDEPEPEIPDEVRRNIHRQAVEWVAGLLLHELAAPIGLAHRAALKEVSDPSTSKTVGHLDNARKIFVAIEQLKNAATVPAPEQFDLSQLVTDLAAEESTASGIQIAAHGPRPLLIHSGQKLLRLALLNGIRNAVEVLKEFQSADPHPILVSWDMTDVDYWVAVRDRGPGIAGPTEAAFEIGKTTKRGHSGFGLAIARQAMQTLNGSVSLQPAAGGGTVYEVRWER